jgi:hypothetical protein
MSPLRVRRVRQQNLAFDSSPMLADRSGPRLWQHSRLDDLGDAQPVPIGHLGDQLCSSHVDRTAQNRAERRREPLNELPRKPDPPLSCNLRHPELRRHLCTGAA